MHTVSKNIVEFLGSRTALDIEHKDWCIYALEKKLYKTLCFVVILILGCFIGAPIECMLVFVVNNFLRTKISGWHAQSPVLCFSLTISMCGVGGFVSVWIANNTLALVYIFILMNSCLSLFFTPINNAKLHFTATEMIENKKIGKRRIGIILMVSVIILFLTPLSTLAISLQIGSLLALASTFIKE